MFACSITGSVVGGSQLETNFIFDEARPFEVRLQSVTGEDFVFDRDLLGDAFSNRPAGVGWIRFHVAADRLIIRFGYDIASAYLSYPANEVQNFLDRAYEAVPWGSESIDFDALLEAFNEDKI